jgi:hypothetical protein
MLTDTKLRNLKPKDKLYQANDRDGLYVAVKAAGAISFRCNYSIQGRQENITFRRYGVRRRARGAPLEPTSCAASIVGRLQGKRSLALNRSKCFG